MGSKIILALALLLCAGSAFAQHPVQAVSGARVSTTGGGGGDVTAPACTITTPATDPFDAGSSSPQSVEGACTDAVGVTGVSYLNTNTNQTAPCSGTPGTTFNFVCSVTVTDFTNPITVTGKDLALNAGVDTVTITFTTSGAVCSHCIQPSTSFRSTDTGSSGAGWTGTTQGVNFSTKQTNITGSNQTPIDTVEALCNNPSGLGGLGLCHQVGNTDTGVGVSNGSGARFTHAAVTEAWFQMCVKFPSPWAWVVGNGNSNASADPFNLKMVYNNSTSRTLTYGGQGMQFTVLSTTYTSGARMGETNIKWAGTFSDNDWHRVELHLKTDTNGANGVVQVWQDGVLGIDVSTANYNMGTFEAWVVPSNMRYANNAVTPTPAWFDDVQISVTQRINLDIC